MSNHNLITYIIKNNSRNAFYIRRFIILFIDCFIFSFSSFFAFILLEKNFILNLSSINWIIISIIPIGSITYSILNNYKYITRFLGSRQIRNILISNFIIIFNLIIIGRIFNFPSPINRYWFLLWILISSITIFARYTFRELFIFLNSYSNEKIPNVAIYGAGDAGAILSNNLIRTNSHNIKYFIDDNPIKWGRSINAIPIISSKEIRKIKKQIDCIFLSIPSATYKQKSQIISEINKLGIKIFQTPNYFQLATGEAEINQLSPISIENLLDRKILKSNTDKLFQKINGSVVLITGAGGSIGSELSIQLIKLEPKVIILIDMSEPDLYRINEDLKDIKNNSKLYPVLGNITNEKLLKKILSDFSVDFIFHAAAYKHVPMVEANPIEGISNNFYSTKIICELALEAKVKEVVLISSDKAVRPTSIMGASKRLSELIVQMHYDLSNSLYNPSEDQRGTNFSIVRFGNVLGSSGSVLPLFLKQISKGGPITITDRNIIRYFMTISEAVNLVLETTLLPSSANIYILDMGKPIRIVDLAEQVIKLSGLTIKNEENPKGDIEIIDIGLRPGEKLFEELLVDGKSIKTKNPLIFKSQEKYVTYGDLISKINQLDKSIKNYDKEKILNLLKVIIPEWKVHKKKEI